LRLTILQAESALSYIGKTLRLSVQEEASVRSLSIGAGGNIVQHIERDHNDPRIWDVASSKLLNVQLIDSRTFKLVTGLEPPETPITPETYKQMGLPFYKLWRDEGKKDGVAGSWGSVMGSKEVVSKNMKQKATSYDGGGAASTDTGNWGLLKSGVWGKLDDREEDAGEGSSGGGEGFKDPSFDFPVLLLDVDDTIPKFKSVIEAEDGGWDGEEEGIW